MHARSTPVSGENDPHGRRPPVSFATEVHRFRQIYDTIRPHQTLGDPSPRQAYLEFAHRVTPMPATEVRARLRREQTLKR